MRLSPAPQTLVLLQALLCRPFNWRFGYELSRVTGLRHGTIYPQLLRLEAFGLLESRWEETNGRTRHLYRVTKRGYAEANALLRQSGWEDLIPGPPGEELAAGS